MSRSLVTDEHLQRHPVATCDKCGQTRTLDVCEQKGWLLGAKDLCNICRPRHRATLRKAAR